MARLDADMKLTCKTVVGAEKKRNERKGGQRKKQKGKEKKSDTDERDEVEGKEERWTVGEKE